MRCQEQLPQLISRVGSKSWGQVLSFLTKMGSDLCSISHVILNKLINLSLVGKIRTIILARK